MSQLKALFVSLEDGTLNETELLVAADDTIEVEIAEAGAAEVEANQAGDAVEELGEITEGLESIICSMEAAMEDGGLTPQSALFMQHAVQAHTARLGMGAADVVSSMESFGGASGQAAATTISMEGIKETIKKIWLAIKNAVTKAIAAIRNFFAKIFGGVAKLKQRSEALRKAVAELTEENGQDVNVPSATTLQYKGKVDVASIISGLGATKTAGDKVYNNVVTMAQTFYTQSVNRVLKSAELDEAGEEAITKDLETATDNITVVYKEVTQSPVMSGDASYRAGQTTNDEKGSTSGITVPSLVKGYGFKAVDDAHSKISAPSKAELVKVLGGVDAIIVQLEGKKQSLEGLTKAREDALKATEKKVEGWSNKLKEGVRQSRISMTMRFVNRDVTKPVNQLYSHQFSVVRAALALVERGVASHKKGPAKK